MKTITLEIVGVPDVESVKAEILCNAETTIKNYWDKEIRVVPEEKEIEFQAKILEFKVANTAEVAKPIEEVIEEPIEEIVL